MQSKVIVKVISQWVCHLWKCSRSVLLSEEQNSNPYIIESIRAIGPLVLPVIGLAFIVNYSLDKQIVSTKELITSNKKETEKSINAIKEASEKQIIANREIITLLAQASETKIEKMLDQFLRKLPS